MSHVARKTAPPSMTIKTIAMAIMAIFRIYAPNRVLELCWLVTRFRRIADNGPKVCQNTDSIDFMAALQSLYKD